MKWGRNKGGDAKPAGVGGVSFDAGEDASTGASVAGTSGSSDGTDGGIVDPDADTGGVRTLDMSADAPASAEAAPAAAPAAKKGAFGKGLVKVKEPKPAKETKVKPEKAPREKKARIEEEPSLPITVVIDFYLGITKEREAEQLIRAQIEKNFDAPNASYLYMQRWRDGIAVEMQEGGGKAYLPEVLAKLDEDPTALVAVAMSNRFAQVRLDPDTKSLETLLLVANQEPPETAFVALPTRPMRPYDRRGSRVFMSGVALLAASSMAMLFAVGAFFIDTNAWAIPYVQQTAVKDLPMAQSEKITQALQSGSDCIYKMEFNGGAWTVTGGHDGGGACAAGPAPAAAPVTDPSMTPGAIPGATAPGLPALPAGAPTGAGAPVTAPPVAPITGAGAPPSSPTAPPVFGPPAGAPAAPGAVPGR